MKNSNDTSWDRTSDLPPRYKQRIPDAYAVKKLNNVFHFVLGPHIAPFPVIGCKVTVSSKSGGRHDFQRGASSGQNSKFDCRLLRVGHVDVRRKGKE